MGAVATGHAMASQSGNIVGDALPLPPVAPPTLESHVPAEHVKAAIQATSASVADGTKQSASLAFPAPPLAPAVEPVPSVPGAVDAEKNNVPSSVGTVAAPAVEAEKKSALSAVETAAAPDVIKWEELLNDDKERYYHELATGKTQWELPTVGWVQLIDDDGTPYYWNPVTGITDWTKPVA